LTCYYWAGNSINMSQKGFTLIEMLIALTIFSLLIGVLLMGFSQGLTLWHKGQNKSTKWITLEHRYDWLDRLFSQAIAAQYKLDDGRSRVAPFFSGDKLSMTLLTVAPIMDTSGSLKQVEFCLLEKAEKQTLMYREKKNSKNVWIEQDFKSVQWIPLLKTITKAYFRYEAPKNPFPENISIMTLPRDIRQRYRNAPEWMSEFDSKSIMSLPQRIEFFFIDKDGEEHHWIFQCRFMPDIWPDEVYNEE